MKVWAVKDHKMDKCNIGNFGTSLNISKVLYLMNNIEYESWLLKAHSQNQIK